MFEKHVGDSNLMPLNFLYETKIKKKRVFGENFSTPKKFCSSEVKSESETPSSPENPSPKLLFKRYTTVRSFMTTDSLKVNFYLVSGAHVNETLRSFH